jgi:N-acetylneuraminate synthase
MFGLAERCLMTAFDIGDRRVGAEEPTYVVAEAGSNHNGSLETARELIDVAADAGADAVKFQTFRAEDMYVKDSGGVEYLDDDRSIYEIIESMEMPYEWIPELAEHCADRDVQFLSTPFDERSADELARHVPAWKVASYAMSHHPFLRSLAATGKPILMSTGAHEMTEVRESVSVLRDAGCDALCLLQCVAAYPTPLDDINVRVVRRLVETFGLPAGLSDHTLDPKTAPAAAVALGASVIEKHFTLDREMDGPDHEFALEPAELDEMVSAIRATERALGDGDKRVLDVESELHGVARRRIHATRNITAGEQFTEDNVAVLRSGRRDPGLAPRHYDDVLGARAARDVQRDAGVKAEDVDADVDFDPGTAQ